MERIIGIVLLLVSLSVQPACAQNDSMEKVNHIRQSAHLIIDSLHLMPAKEFYTQTVPDDSAYTYVYVSSRDSVARRSPGRFYYYGTDPALGRAKADSFSKIGYDVMVYLTAGTSASVINKHLLSYDPLSISFIMLHEAMHLHVVRAGLKITYDYEECIGDVVGNAYLKYLFPRSQQKAIKRFVKCNEKVYRKINKCLKGRISKAKCEEKIYDITNTLGTSFQKERYQYPVNNAYLLRFRDYTLHYFKLRRKFRRGNTINESLIQCFGKPKTVPNNPDSHQNKK